MSRTTAQAEGYVLETVRESVNEVNLQPGVAQFQIKHTTMDQGFVCVVTQCMVL